MESRHKRLGHTLNFGVGDRTDGEPGRGLVGYAPFDVALFVGLSSWPPRPQTVRHLRWLAANLRQDGLLVSDCFSAAPYALGGRRLGYRAHYYSSALYRCLLDHCGFDGSSMEIQSGRDSINHVLVAEPERTRQAFAVTRQAAPRQSLASHA